jgi:hypothetical protein
MLNNFIYAQTKDMFLEALGAGHILDEAIVFIEDTREIWNHGTYFAAVPVNVSAFNNDAGYITEAQTVILIDSAIEEAITKTLSTSV